MNSEILNSVEKFNGVTWERAASMNVKRHGFASLVYGDYIYALGGSPNHGVLNYITTVEVEFLCLITARACVRATDID